jgi:predicted phosphodiesterase
MRRRQLRAVASLRDRTCLTFGLLLSVWSLACGPGSANATDPSRQRPLVSVLPADQLRDETLTLPNALTSVKFAVIGDSGRGTAAQQEVAAQMSRFRDAFDFPFVLMLGDNIYEGPATTEDYRLKFEAPYHELLARDVRFFAVLGNHDDPRQVSYAPFNMNGERYYSFVPPEDVLTRVAASVEFFALDSSNLDRVQLAWLDERLARSRAAWKIVFLHHPLYTSGRYARSARVHRWALEPILTRRGVDVVFSGHEHIYQRATLQQGIQYFVSGAAGSLRRGDGVLTPAIARSYSDDYHFMLVEVEGDDLHFQAISRTGLTVDAGTLQQRRDVVPATGSTDTRDRR